MYQSSPQTNPTGPASGSYRVLRGGTWHFNSNFLRASARFDFTPSATVPYIGFRVARNP
jgi:formylglycine-generating enzyme required for sulfatase activity